MAGRKRSSASTFCQAWGGQNDPDTDKTVPSIPNQFYTMKQDRLNRLSWLATNISAVQRALKEHMTAGVYARELLVKTAHRSKLEGFVFRNQILFIQREMDEMKRNIVILEKLREEFEFLNESTQGIGGAV